MNYSDLYKDYFPRLTTVACIWVTSQDAEDIVQDVLVRLWEEQNRLAFLNGDLYAYAFMSVKNRCLDKLRAQARMRRYHSKVWSEVQNAPDWEGPLNQLEYRETERRLHHAIGTLRGRAREVFMMSRKEGLTYAEIARRLGISVNTVECHMSAALSRLRKQMSAA